VTATAEPASPWRVEPGARSASLHNIVNVDAFVWHVMGDPSRAGMTSDELEEWHARGREALLRIGREWDGRGDFVPFAAQRLRLRLTTAWNQIKGNQNVTRNKVRTWEPGPALVSIDALREQGRDDLTGSVPASEGVAPFELRLRDALRAEIPAGFDDVMELSSRVGLLFAQGLGEREVAVELSVSVANVREARGWLADAVERLA
jgi:hypothetical protein